jgi:plastocyanin
MYRLFFALTLALTVAGCNQGNTAPERPQQTQQSSKAAPPVDTSQAGAIRGVVNFTGAAPQPVKIDMGLDPACNMTGPNYSEQVVAHDGKLANVYVYVKSGLTPHSYPAPTQPVTITQKGCKYVPHVAAARTGQTIRITNDDPAMHNIHPAPNAPGNHEWNVSQMPKGAPIERTFDAPEVLMPVKCNQHPWMKMYLSINATPYFAVSGQDGSFNIPNLPAGDYVLAAVHEKYGEKDVNVHVAPKQTASADFTYSAQ